MSLFSFSKNKKDKGGIVAVFDIRSASVGGALVLLRKNKNPRVLYTIRKQLDFKEELDVKNFTSTMIRALDSVVSDLEKNGVVHLNFRALPNKEIKEAFCSFSSPWYVSQMQTVKIKKDNPFYVTDEIIQSLIKKEREDFEKEEMGFFGKDNKVEIIDNKIIQFRLNGYRTENPFKKKVKDVEASVFMSLISADVADKIEKTILKGFHFDKIHMHSSSLISFLGIRDMFETEDDFVMLDVSGEVTDVSYIKNDVLREVQTFPAGKNVFIREIIKDFNTNYNDASSMIVSYVKDTLDVKSKEKLEKIIEKISKNWLKFLENSMLDLSDGAILPRTIFLVTDDYIGDILVKIIKESNFTKLVFPDYNKSIHPILMNKKRLEEFCEFPEGIKKDVFIGMDSVFIHRLS